MRIGLAITYVAAGVITALAFAYHLGDTSAFAAGKGSRSTTTTSNGPTTPPKKPQFYGTEHGGGEAVVYPRSGRECRYCYETKK